MTRRFTYRTMALAAVFCGLVKISPAQTDTTKPFIPVDSINRVATPLNDTARTRAVMRAHSPKKAAIRSAILPGWGQVYNRKYWKVPIVYGVLAIPTSIFIYNLRNYRELRFAYRAKFEAQPKRDPVTGNIIPGDSTNYWRIKPHLLPLDINALRSYRDDFRSNIDYSILAIILVWGLNVVDATVDAHLKAFDVSPDLSFKIKFGHSDLAGTNGLSLVLAIR